MLELIPSWAWSIIKAALILPFVLVNVLMITWLERKISAFMQNRIGPNRVGPAGLLQAVADGIKFMAKEDIIPATADRWLFILAPIIAVATAMMVWVVIPFGPSGAATDLDIGIVYIAAATSLAIITIFMGGWGSNNKYSLLGAMRGAAQMISYEIALVLSILGVVMMTGSLNLQEIVLEQGERGLFGWFIFPQIVGFIIYTIAALAELNRAPFDLLEAESEIVAGYHTEYSGIRWLSFMLAEYGHLFSWSAIAATMFMGGWLGPTPAILAGIPGLGFLQVFDTGIWPTVFGFFWLMFKTYLFIFLAIWIRWTLPRIRIDQLMDLGWKFLLPVSLVNVFITGLVMMATRG